MKYKTPYGGAPGVEQQFDIFVDDSDLSWTSDPPGKDIAEPLIDIYCTLVGGDGAFGSGKNFDILPGGSARLSH